VETLPGLAVDEAEVEEEVEVLVEEPELAEVVFDVVVIEDDVTLELVDPEVLVVEVPVLAEVVFDVVVTEDDVTLELLDVEVLVEDVVLLEEVVVVVEPDDVRYQLALSSPKHSPTVTAVMRIRRCN
jgi:hypothetical protein